MNYPTQPERLTTQARPRIIAIASQMVNSGSNGMPSQFIEDWDLPKSLSQKTASKIIYAADCANKQCKEWAFALTKIADECIAPMTWTDETPTEGGFYLFVDALYASVTRDPLSWAKMVHVRNIDSSGLSVTFDSICVSVAALRGKWLRIKYDE